MAGSFQRLKEKMQRFFWGNDEPSVEEEKGKEAGSTAAGSRPAQLHKQSDSRIKMMHYYPKSESDKLDLKLQKRETEKDKENKKAQKERFSTPPEKQENQAPAAVGNKKEDSRAYFQGNDFTAEHIPSPIFGFENVPLHSSYLKKHAEMVQPQETQEDERTGQEPELFEATPAVSAVPPEEETVTAAIETPPSENKEKHEAHAGTDEEGPAVETGTTLEVTEKTEKIEETESAEERNEKPAPASPASRQERRRRERESAQAPRTESTAERSAVPFNVLRHPEGKPERASAGKTTEAADTSVYQFPSIQLLAQPPKKSGMQEEDFSYQKQQLEQTLRNFNVDAEVVDMTKGPSVTRYEVQPAAGVKVNKITNLTDDIKLSMAAKDLRMEAPIPGKNTIGIEVPNAESDPVLLREILRRDAFIRKESPLTVAMGLDISGSPIVTDLQDMPHGLIAGATGSGKSVCINSILLSLLYKADPNEVKLMLIDPKMVELASYKDIPHLVTPVINDAKEATAGLKRAVAEMNERYEKLAAEGVRDIKKYNEKMENVADKMPYIVIVIDELADLMMVSPQDVEDAICRIAQKARACGIHLLVATQRPSVDVITGLIKANIPSRTAFAVSSQADSRTILDAGGAERLIGKGDMLFHQNGTAKPLRVQGTFVTDEEIDAVTNFVKQQKEPSYIFKREDLQKKAEQEENSDELFPDACLFVSEQGGASSSLLQRRFSIGYNRAARLIDMMENQGIISEANGSKPRRVLLSEHDIQEQISS
ncbi:DNA translocase FtsK [Salibacterium halotolerans]|uniref:DNA segregation ATPase FtsK/SpoIIIE, S-DNA-T family n=1 Tax=Salibacterium halotolerans TaxID=1884432 RepID=A0A1I5VKW7_9BACI|nr:DNA translocase FtsK [Salibacterium halotolerans]SFQ08110.1 DNA segregation ATPase FtsK/SpoIIIE, S-DNA-T family [Salibacterium halotolerans]